MDNTVSLVIWMLIGFAALYGAVRYFLGSPAVTKDKPVRWSALEAVGITLFIYFAAQVIAAAVILPLFAIFKGSFEDAVAMFDGNVWGQFGYAVIVQACSIGLLLAFLQRRSTKIANIGLVRPRSKDVLYAIGGFVAYYAVFALALGLIAQFFPQINLDQRQELGFDEETTTGLALIPVFITLVVLPPLVEEIIARGFLYTGLRQQMPKIIAAVITSILFAAAHLLGGEAGTVIWVAAIDTFLLSFVLVYLRERTSSLWPAIYLHAIKNGLAFLVLFIFV